MIFMIMLSLCWIVFGIYQGLNGDIIPSYICIAISQIYVVGWSILKKLTKE